MKNALYPRIPWQRIMQLTAFPLLLTLLVATFSLAEPGSAQPLLDKPVTIQLSGQELKNALTQLERATQTRFVYRPALIRSLRAGTLTARNERLATVLDRLLRPVGLGYEVNGDYIILNRLPAPGTLPPAIPEPRLNPAPQDRPVSGQVTDGTGQGLPGVNVVVKGAQRGTTTNAEGRFQLNVPDAGETTLLFSFIGYVTQEVIVGNQTTLNIVLQADDKTLNEVVVVGYGTQKRADLTGAIGSVGPRDIRDQVVARPDQALAGKIAGVQVRLNEGTPGAGPQIRIRGVNSISQSNDPLVVIDGFPGGSLATLNPADIESIDVLKDASAAAIYGSRAANGVVLVTTKRAKDGKARVSFNAYRGVQQVERYMDLMNAREIAQYQFDAVRNQNLDERNDISGDPTRWRRPVDQATLDVINGTNTTDTDWQREIFRQAPIQNYQLAFSGRSGRSGYYVSGEYFDQEGVVINSGFRRYSARVNLDANVSDKFKIAFNLNPSFAQRRFVPTGGGSGENDGVITNAITIQPFFPVRNPDGSFFNAFGKPGGANANNPVAVAELLNNRNQEARVLSNFTAGYELLPGLTANLLAGIDYASGRGRFFRPQNPVFNFGPAFGSSSSSQTINWLTEYTLNYNRTFGAGHSVQALAGYTVQKNQFESNFLASDDYPNNLIQDLTAVSNRIDFGNSLAADWSLLSWVGRVNYNYKERYYLTASVRRDGSSRFGPANRWATFPSLAGAWRISEEQFLRGNRVLSNLKLRASLGFSGNNNIPDYEFIPTVGFVNYPFGGVTAGYAPNKIANPSLQWERLREVNVGLDVGLLNNRLGLTVEYFDRQNKDLLLLVAVPGITGFGGALQNIGAITNRGLEVSLNTRNFAGAFSWNTDLNFSFYRNRVDALGQNNDAILTSPGIYPDFSHITQIGRPVGMFYGWVADGVIRTADELSRAPIFGRGTAAQTRVGDLRFVDQNGDGLITPDDRTAMGNPHPRYLFGVTNTFAYKGLDLSVVVQGVIGHQILMANKFLTNNTRGRHNHPREMLDHWRSEQDPGGGAPRPNNSPTGNNRGVFSSFHLEDGSFVRINNLTLGYTVPASLLKRVGVGSVRVYSSVQNLLTSTRYTGYNPDVSNSGDSRGLGVDASNYPTVRTVSFGLNVGF